MPQRKLLQSFRNIAKIFLIYILVVFLICLVPAIIFAPFLIKVKNVECLTQYGDCSKDISETLIQYNGKSLFLAKKKIKLAFGREKSISRYTLQFKFPDTLRVYLLIKKPVFCITNSNNFLLISDSGAVISKSSECNLPKLTMDSINKNVGDNIDDSSLYMLKIIQGVYDMYQVKEGTFINNSLTVELKPGLRVIFPMNADSQVGISSPEALLGALRLIYTKIESEAGNFREIDLRFKNPVLR